MSKPKKTEKEMDVEITKAVGLMQNYGFLGLTEERLVKDTGAMNFFKGVLRQQGLTEGEIEDVKLYLEKKDEEKPVVK
jgi:hypothetical protein